MRLSDIDGSIVTRTAAKYLEAGENGSYMCDRNNDVNKRVKAQSKKRREEVGKEVSAY